MHFSQFFEEPDSKKKSVTRLVFFLWSLGVLISWAYVSISNKQLTAIDNSVTTTLLGLAAAKTAQRYMETPEKTTEEKKE